MDIQMAEYLRNNVDLVMILFVMVVVALIPIFSRIENSNKRGKLYLIGDVLAAGAVGYFLWCWATIPGFQQDSTDSWFGVILIMNLAGALAAGSACDVLQSSIFSKGSS